MGTAGRVRRYATAYSAGASSSVASVASAVTSVASSIGASSTTVVSSVTGSSVVASPPQADRANRAVAEKAARAIFFITVLLEWDWSHERLAAARARPQIMAKM